MVQEMQTLSGLEHAYSVVHMKKGATHFADAVVLTEEERRACVLEFRMSTLLQNFYNRKPDTT